MIDAELRNILMRIGHDINTIANDVRARHLAELRKKAAEHEYWKEREAAEHEYWKEREAAVRENIAASMALKDDWHSFIMRLIGDGTSERKT